MANFKVAYRVDMKTKGEDGLAWEPGCPVAFRAIQVSRNVNTADAFLQAEVRNVSGEEIGSFKARFNVSYEPVAIPRPKLLGLSDDARDGRQAPASACVRSPRRSGIRRTVLGGGSIPRIEPKGRCRLRYSLRRGEADWSIR